MVWMITSLWGWVSGVRVGGSGVAAGVTRLEVYRRQ